MDKKTKITLIIIGILSVLAGIGVYFEKQENINALFAIFIGLALIGTVFFIKKEKL